MKTLHAEFLRFCVVGGVGLVVDSSTTLTLVGQGLGPALARVCGFLMAASVTWALHRHFTFRSNAGLRTWLTYLLSTGLGALINFTVYLLWLHWAGSARTQVVIGICLGSVLALGFNFLISKRLIFK